MTITTPYSTLILGVFSLHQIAHYITVHTISPHTGPKIFGREIIFQEFQPMWSRYLNVKDKQTDNIRSQYRAMHLVCIAR